MCKRDKCFTETKKQHVLFAACCFLLALQGGDLRLQVAWMSFALKIKNPSGPTTRMTSWSWRLEDWPSNNLVLRHSPPTPQKDDSTPRMWCVWSQQRPQDTVWGEGANEREPEPIGSSAAPSVSCLWLRTKSAHRDAQKRMKMFLVPNQIKEACCFRERPCGEGGAAFPRPAQPRGSEVWVLSALGTQQRHVYCLPGIQHPISPPDITLSHPFKTDPTLAPGMALSAWSPSVHPPFWTLWRIQGAQRKPRNLTESCNTGFLFPDVLG